MYERCKFVDCSLGSPCQKSKILIWGVVRKIVELQSKTGKIVEWQLFSKTNKLVERQSKTGKIREWQLRVSNMDKIVEWQPKTGKIVEWQLTTPKIKIFDF